MGAVLPKPVLSTIVERKALANGFRVGMAEMNGWRNKMEDAHVVHMKDTWGFFGVFDGHGGDQCSAYVAQKFYAQLEEFGCPVDDDDVKKIIFKIDQDFLDSGTDSGSTGAMCICHRSPEPGGKMRLRVINIGDSRVLLGKRDGTIVDGGGTDFGLSTDHKPDHPSEKERIYRCGGTVPYVDRGPARVNGDLAVSRAFGDAEFKKTGGPRPEDRVVTVEPELGVFECDEADFAVIVCDGVSEGDFSNSEVIKLIADHFKEHDDLGAAARAVIFKAEQQNSRDNITCMIVMFNGSDTAEDRMEFIPGPIVPDHRGFMDAYQSMAKRADMTLPQAVSLRLDIINQEIEDKATMEEKRAELKKEAGLIGEPRGEKGSAERTEWFDNWRASKEGPSDSGSQQQDMLQMLMASRGQQQMGGAPDRAPVRVRCPDRETLYKAIEEHPELKWEARMEELPETEGIVKTEDESDGTMQVRFPSAGVEAWLPTAVLTVLDAAGTGGSGPTAASAGYEGASAPDEAPSAPGGE